MLTIAMAMVNEKGIWTECKIADNTWSTLMKDDQDSVGGLRVASSSFLIGEARCHRYIMSVYSTKGNELLTNSDNEVNYLKNLALVGV